MTGLMSCFKNGTMQGMKDNSVMGIAEDQRHQKKKQSSISKARTKSRHKHLYKECLFVNKKGRYEKGKYCTICGKVGERTLETERITGNTYRKLADREIYETYEHLEKVEIEETIPKYLPIRRTSC